MKRQLLDPYIKGIFSLTSYYGIYTIKIRSLNTFYDKYLIQTDDVDLEFSKGFTKYTKNIQHRNSQWANSILTNDVFSLIYSYLSILEIKETESDSPTQTSRHTILRQEIHIFSKFLHEIRENRTNDQITQNVEHDSQKILAWFKMEYFGYIIDLIEQARKQFWPQNTDDETVLAEQSNYVWDPEWFYELFINIPTDVSSQAISAISFTKDYVRVYPFTVDATPLNYNSLFSERAGNNSLSSTFINNDKLNGTKNLTQQNIQITSHFTNEEINETITTKEAQRSISPTQPNFTTPKLKKTNVTTNSHTINSKTLCCAKIFESELPNGRPVTKPSYISIELILPKTIITT